MWIHLGIWVLLRIRRAHVRTALNKIIILGFPLGFYMAAQGSLIAFVVQLFVFASSRTRSTAIRRRRRRLRETATWLPSTSGEDNFLNNLGKIYGLYTGGFLPSSSCSRSSNRSACRTDVLGYLFVFFTIAVYAVIGVLSRTAEVSGILRRGPKGAGVLQRHGNGRGLDVGGFARRHGRHALPARL